MHICVYMDLTSWKTCLFLLWTYFILFSFTVKHPRYFIREDWQQQTDRHRSTSPSKLFSSSTDLQGQPIFSQTSFHNSGSFPYRSFTTFPMCPTTATALAAGVRIPGLFRSPAGGCAEASGKPQRGPGMKKVASQGRWCALWQHGDGKTTGNTGKFHEISLLTYIAKICQSWTIPILIFADIDTLSMVPEKA